MVGLSHMRGAAFWQEKLSGVSGGSVVVVASVRGSPGPLDCTPSGPSHCMATPICLCVQLEGDRFPLCVGAGTGAQSQASAGRRARRSKRTGGSDQGSVSPRVWGGSWKEKWLHGFFTDLFSFLECSYQFLLHYFKWIWYSPFLIERKIEFNPPVYLFFYFSKKKGGGGVVWFLGLWLDT